MEGVINYKDYIMPSYIITDQYKIIDISDGLIKLTGYSKDDLVNRSLLELTAILKVNIGKKFELDKEIIQVTLVTKYYETKEITLVKRKFDDKRVIYFEIKKPTLEDRFSYSEYCPNELRKQSCLIKEQKEQLWEIIESIQNVLSISDKNGNYIKIDKFTREIFHENNNSNLGDFYKEAEFFDFKGKKLTEEELPFYRVSKGEKVEHSKFIILKDNKEYYLDITGIPVLDENEKFNMGVFITNDITSEVQKTKELQRTLKMQEEFFSFISHEFRTPLTVMHSAIQALEVICKDELTDRSKKYISKIRQSTLQQLRLVNNLLDISRAEAGYLKVHNSNIDIVAMTKGIVNSVILYGEQKGVSIKFSSSVSEKVIEIDDEKYERIMLNLLSNAIKFTPSGKSIYVSLDIENKNISIKVIDEGIGIPKDKQHIIFERFRQLDNGNLTKKDEGTGIGLSLVKLLVTEMNGNITVDSEPGKGSKFTLFLPIKEVEATGQNKMIEFSINDRIIQSVHIEFSNIYL